MHMRIITISREFGSGGRELGKRMADALHFDYYDREIITAIAQNKGVSADYVENKLNQPMPITLRRSFSSMGVQQMPQISLLLEQKKVIEHIAALGRDCIIVGRNADVLLRAYNPFSLFVCADTESKINRCIERAAEGERVTPSEVQANMRRIDKNRARTRDMLTDSQWGDRRAYNMMINTTGMDLKQLAPAAAQFALSWWEAQKK